MLKPGCPHCQMQVDLLGPEWLNQKGQRVCPHCKQRVLPRFKGSSYTFWLSLFIVASIIGLHVFGNYGFAIPFSVAFIAPLVPSIYLAKENS